MGSKPAQPKFTTGLEEYIQKTQQSFERSITEAATPEIRKEKQLSRKISLWEVDCAEKYKLKSSALAMIARLKPERSGRIEDLPGTGIWVVLDNPELSNLYFSSMGSQLRRMSKAAMPSSLQIGCQLLNARGCGRSKFLSLANIP